MLIRWFLSIILNAIALIAVAQLFDSFHLEGFGTAILASFILSILNVLVKPILIIFTLPITFLTLGLFLFVINAITLMITQGLMDRSEEHTSELQSRGHLVCRLLLEKKNITQNNKS